MNKRSSNMELLRIAAMLIIITYHIFCHCINFQLSDWQTIVNFDNGLYCQPVFFKRLCLLAVIAPLGQVGNAIFIIISGYFMAHKESIDLTKIAKKLLMQLGFAAIVLGMISIYAYKNITGITLKMIPFTSFNWLSWFVGYYFVIIVAAKIFLNKFLNKLNQKKYTMFIVTLFALVQFGWSTSLMAKLSEGVEVLCTGIFLYSLGGYIRKYNPFEKIRLWAVIAVAILMNLILICNFYISTADNILAFDPTSGNAFIQYIPMYTDNQIFPIVLGIVVFEIFRRIKLPSNSVINFMGASTFMVYLLHDNEFFYKLWNTQDWITLLHEHVISFVLTYVGWVMAIFAAGVLCYCLFTLIGMLAKRYQSLVLKDN